VPSSTSISAQNIASELNVINNQSSLKNQSTAENTNLSTFLSSLNEASNKRLSISNNLSRVPSANTEKNQHQLQQTQPNLNPNSKPNAIKSSSSSSGVGGTGGFVSSTNTMSSSNNDMNVKRRAEMNESVFRVNKGVKTFDFSFEKNLLITGGKF
jgi:hypothetical protein